MKPFLIFLSFGLSVAAAVLGNTCGASEGKKLVLTGTVYDINHAVIVSGEVVA
jgi:hypothetical protein